MNWYSFRHFDDLFDNHGKIFMVNPTAKQRWNFDFEKEQPLPGRYEWVKLDEHGNEVYNPLETKDRVENLQTMQEDNDVTMEDHTGDYKTSLLTLVFIAGKQEISFLGGTGE
ncbi:hypothetical protein E2986_10639 [Frieseomelitta varia]|uniref:Cyclin-dependent kinase inhibitor domain-containing protein n=1 Tax=Frieseomelitta varia TaxID=561572 RepID=A0A833VXJ8_9HYME|nr:hypothetical protein E2986_10639 [Frieseomelitta varia]